MWSVIGICSECGGKVIDGGTSLDGTKLPDQCTQCGATNGVALPVIPMNPSRWRHVPGPTCDIDVSQYVFDGPQLNPWGGYGGMTTQEGVLFSCQT